MPMAKDQKAKAEGADVIRASGMEVVTASARWLLRHQPRRLSQRPPEHDDVTLNDAIKFAYDLPSDDLLV
jgi:hypothetical protein